jgi:hypothetical protein
LIVLSGGLDLIFGGLPLLVDGVDFFGIIAVTAPFRGLPRLRLTGT